jgi:putative Mn2+ efflux pump MntP
MIALVLVAASVGLSNFAAAIGIGVGGVDGRVRLRVGLVFGLFEAGMPVVGLLIGQRLEGDLGRTARWISAALLIAVGAYGLITSLRAGGGADGQARPVTGAHPGGADGEGRPVTGAHPARLLLSAFALSLDNLVVGFALGAYQVSLITGAAIFGAVSVVMTLAGLELGARIGRRAGPRGEQIGGAILISVGVAIAAGVFS